MDLVVHEVVELEDVHVAHRDGVREGLTGAAVEQAGLAVGLDQLQAVGGRQRGAQQPHELVVPHAVEDGRGHGRAGLGLDAVLGEVGGPGLAGLAGGGGVPAAGGDPSQVQLENLSDVHTAGHAQRVEDDVDRGAVGQEGHVLHGQDLGDDALVAVAAGELVTDGDLAALGDVDAHHAVDARGQLGVVGGGVDLAHAGDDAVLAVGHAQGGVAHLAGLLAEDGAQEALLAGQLGLPLGGHLAHEDVAAADLGADADDAALVEVGQGLLADVGDVAGDLLGAQLGVAGVDLVLLDVDRGEHVLGDHTLGDDDGVLVVEALPGHEGDQEVLAQGQVSLVGGGAVGQDRTDLDALTLGGHDPLVVAVALVGAAELGDLVDVLGAVVVRHAHEVRADLGDDTGLVGHEDVAGVDGGAPLHARAHQRGVGADERHGLALHVGAHEGAVGVVVLEEGDEGGTHRHHLARRDVHEVHLRGGHEGRLAAGDAAQDVVLGEVAVLGEGDVGLGDDVAVLVVGRQVVGLVGDPAVDDDAVGGLDEAEGVDAPEGRQRADEADVGALGGLDGAHAPVVRGVDVADLHGGALTGQTAGAQGAQAALVGQARQRVVLVHELAELGGAEELLDRGRHGPDVDERVRRDGLDVLGGHALAHLTLHTAHTGTHLRLDELAHRTDAAVAQVVDVVVLDGDLGDLAVTHALDGLGAGVQGQQVAQGRDDVLNAQGGLGQVRGQAQLLVDLVAADLGQVVALGVEVEVLQQGAAGLDARRLTGADLLVDVQERLVLGGDLAVLVQGGGQGRVVGELLADLRLVHAQGQQEDGDVLLALAVDAHRDAVGLVDLELEPGTARGDELDVVDVLVRGLLGGALEVHARRAHELGHDDALGAVDDEGALIGHEREVAHEDRLRLDLTGGEVLEVRHHVEGGGVGEVLLLALLGRVLRLLEAVVVEGQGHGLAEVLDRGDLVEDLLQTGGLGQGARVCLVGGGHPLAPPLVTDEPVEALGLEGEQIRSLHGLGDLGKVDTTRRGTSGDVSSSGCGGARGSQRGILPSDRGSHNAHREYRVE